MLRISLLILTIFYTSCSTSPTSTFYTLHQNHNLKTKNEQNNISIKINKIIIPDSLNHSRIVTKGDKNTINIAEFHRWAGSFKQEIQKSIAENLGNILSTNQIFIENNLSSDKLDYIVDIDIRELSGILGQEIELNANWIIKNKNNEIIASKKSLLVKKLENNSFNEYVQNIEALLLDLSGEIAKFLK